MRTIELKVYKFNELSEQAKEKAHSKYNLNVEYDWVWNEALQTIKAFEKKQSIVGTSRHSWLEPRFVYSEYSEEIKRLSGSRLMAFLYNNFDFLYQRDYVKSFYNVHKQHRNIRNKEGKNGKWCVYYSSIKVNNSCVLTGMCYDDDFLQPIYDFLAKPDNSDFEDLIKDCFSSLERTINMDIEAYQSIEYFENQCNENDFEFYEDGRMV